MTTALAITYDTARPGKSPASYRVSLGETDDTPTDRLAQHGPVFNDLVIYKGTFANRADACRALLEYIDTNWKLVEFSDLLTGDKRYRLLPLDAKIQTDHGTRAVILASRQPHGTFVHSDP